MKLVIDIKKEKLAFFKELLQSLGVVSYIELDEEEVLKKEISQAVDEINLHKKGELELQSFDSFLDEL
ncbi:MAG: hypothetical protein ACPGVD_08135 [Flavobacteriales bacterium]